MPQNVTTHHYDNARTGWNRNETQLTPGNAKRPTFGRLFSYDQSIIDGIIYAQPLYMSGVQINGVIHNVLFVLTESGTIYAFDADQSIGGLQPWLWKRSLAQSPEVVVEGGKATPVIDAGTGIMYVVGRLQAPQGPPNEPGNFEALIQEGNNIVHYYRDNSDPNLPWSRTVVVSSQASGPACLIESSFRSDPNKPGNFEALIQEDNNIVHYYRDNSDPNLPWNRTVVVSSQASGPAYLIESSFRSDPNKPGNFEALIQEGSNIAHYYRDNSDPNLPWNRTVVVSSQASGPAYLIESSFRATTYTTYFRLHAIDIITGHDVIVSAAIDQNNVPKVPGFGDPQANALVPGEVYFDANMHWNRPALLLLGGVVYVAFGSTGDNPPYHGWIMGFRTVDLQQVGIFCTTPEGAGQDLANNCDKWGQLDLGGGIWQAGFGLAADTDDYIYCMTANGLFGSFGGNPARNYADSLLKLGPDLTLVGSFTPVQPEILASLDLDFGSSGPLVLPDGSGGGKFVVGCGKDANVYLLDRTQLVPANLNQIGNFRSTLKLSSNSSVVPNCGAGPGVWGGPAYYGGPLGDVIYYCGDSGPLQALIVTGGSINPALTASGVPNQTPQSEAFPSEGGAIPVVTSDGLTPGTAVVWVITRPDGANQLHLRAYDAQDLTKGSLFDDTIGTWSGGGAFLAPTVANGKVYVASDRQLAVYGVSPPPARGGTITS
jgi:hypothetical protein